MKPDKKVIISVKNLLKLYGDFTAVNGISFDVYEGEIFGLLGPNGAGKTTTLEILETLAMVGLEDKAKAKYKDLSGGQKQRFSLCTTLINEPKIVFLDEPTTGLDPQSRRNLWDLIRKIRDRGTTVVITTHYMDEAEELCDRVAVMEAGQFVALNSPDNLIDELIAQGFERKKEVKKANLEDVFLHLTGKEWRDE